MSGAIMTEEKIYTVPEIAERLRITARTVRRMIADREIDAFKVRDEYRIKQSALDAYIRRQELKQ